VIITPFDAADELIIVPATIWNPRGAYRELLMAVDTGSTETLVVPHITDELGYGAHLGQQITVIRSVVGREQGYLMPVARFSALGFDMADFRMHIHDLPDGYGIEGILGLSFLRRFDYDVRSIRGELRVAPASPEA
jgi:predicted aspartyl protease